MPRNPRNVKKDPIIETTLRVQAAGTGGSSLPLTSKGDLLSRDSSANVRVGVGSDGQVLLASSSATPGIAWSNVYSAAGASRIGLWYLFGAGIDGSLTLVANTTLAAGEWVRQYTDLTLAGFTLTQNTADYGLCIFVNGTLSMGGGTITSGFTAQAGATRGNGNTLNSPSGYGGTGAASQGGIFVYAYIITGTGLISAAGKPGGNGNDGLSTPSGIVSGGNGNIGTTNSMYLFGTNITTGTAPAGGSSSAGGGNAAGPGGVGGAGGVGPTAAGGADYNQALKDVLAIIYCSAGGWAASANSKRRWITNNAASGAGGSGVNTGGTCAGGGGGGGGGSCGMWPGTPGGAGGAGGAAVASAPSAGQSGGGGGGGGSGSLVSVVCAILSGATLTVNANGGAGGNGGNAFGTNASGGGGGGGGCGGIALYVGPSGPTVTAGAGSGGAAGTKIGASADGVAGSAGTAGRVYSMTL